MIDVVLKVCDVFDVVEFENKEQEEGEASIILFVELPGSCIQEYKLSLSVLPPVVLGTAFACAA